MEPKKTTESKSASKLEAGHPYDGRDDEFPQLDDNDVWLYQLTLEAFIQRNAPGMSFRQITMLRSVCAQARRHNILLNDGT